VKKFIALLAGLFITVASGCATGGLEQATHATIRATDEAVYAALQVWAERYAQREAKNEGTRAADPGGYIERRQELLREQGRVVELRARYSLAVKAAVEGWIKAAETSNAPPDPLATEDVAAIAAQLKEVTQ
jgi:hypothetical protein